MLVGSFDMFRAVGKSRILTIHEKKLIFIKCLHQKDYVKFLKNKAIIVMEIKFSYVNWYRKSTL